MRLISLYIAGLIMFMHCVLPHEHHSELTDVEHEESHISADSLIDYLKLIFHLDMGDGHLDHFDSCQGLDFDLKSPTVVTPLLLSFFDRSLVTDGFCYFVKEYYLKDDPFPDLHLSSFLSLRGPPSIS